MKRFTAACLMMLGFAAIAEAQVCTPAPVGLVSWWSGDGNALDSRSRDNGTLQNGATFAAGHVGQSFSFGGVSSVTIPDSPNLDLLSGGTMETWIFLNNANNSSIIEKGNFFTNQASYTLEILSGLLRFDLYKGDGSSSIATVGASANLLVGNWNHISATWDTTTLRFYVNGVQATVQTYSFVRQDTTDPLIFGDGPTIGQGSFNGNLDEVSLYNRALSGSEIAAIHAAGTAGKCKPTATVAPGNQVGWWSGDGNANDIAGTNNGTLNGGGGFAVGRVGQAFNFDGVNDFVEVPDNAATSITGAITVEAWIKPTTVAGQQGILTKYRNTDQSWYFEITNDGIVEFAVIESGSVFRFVDSPAPVPAGVYSHVAATFDPATQNIRVYINGVLVSSTPGAGSSNVTAIRDSATPVRIGAFTELSTGIAPFNGQIDEASLYNRALTPDEITSIFNAGIAGKLKQNATISTSSLVSLWQGEGNANDTRGANNGTFPAGYAAGRVGQAFRFDGDNDLAVTTGPNAFNSGLGAISIEAWVNPASHGTDTSGTFGNTIVSNADGDGFALRLLNGVIQADLRLTSGNVLQTFGSALPLNQFSHVAITYDGANVRAFLNGVQTGSDIPATGTMRNTANNGICLMIGNDPGVPCLPTSNGFDFHGLIDEAAIYDRALTPAEIRANYKNGNALSAAVGDATITFPSVTIAGATQEIPLNKLLLPPVPFGGSAVLAYDIATSAVFAGSPTVCFSLPTFNSAASFSELRVLHLESGVWQNRTTTSSFATRTLCAQVTSLSPFAIATLAPTAANASIAGRVTWGKGQGAPRVRVTVSGGDLEQPITVTTNAFGYYRFDDLPVGRTYIVEVASKSFSFPDPARIVDLSSDVADIDFHADSP